MVPKFDVDYINCWCLYYLVIFMPESVWMSDTRGDGTFGGVNIQHAAMIKHAPAPCTTGLNEMMEYLWRLERIYPVHIPFTCGRNKGISDRSK